MNANIRYSDPVGRWLSGRPMTVGELRTSLELHGHYSGRCPVNGGPIDPPEEGDNGN